jgi:hypothetical protein
MKTRKLIAKIGQLLEGGRKSKGPDRTSLEELLERLEEKEAQLAAKLAGEDDEDKAAKLRMKIKLLRAQRNKGREALESMR